MYPLQSSPAIPAFIFNTQGRVFALNELAHGLFSSFMPALMTDVFRLFPEFKELATRLMQGESDSVEQWLELPLDTSRQFVALVERYYPSQVETAAQHINSQSQKKQLGDYPLIQLSLVDVTLWTSHFRSDVARASKHHHQSLLQEIAHEINNPLGGLIAVTQLLKQELSQLSQIEVGKTTALLTWHSNADEMISMMLNETARLRDLMKRYLEGQASYTLTPLEVYEPLEKAINIFAHEFPHITMIRDYDSSMPMIKAHADALQQCFLNVLRNAGQAINKENKANKENKESHETKNTLSKKPTVRIKTRIGRHVMVEDTIRRMACMIDIYDNGPGFTPEQLAAVKEHTEFFSHRTRVGLGIKIMRHIIEQHQGQTNLRSRPNETVWTFILPFID